MKIYIKALLAAFLVLVLVACGESDQGSSNEEADNDNNPEEPIVAGKFPDEYLAGNFEKINKQTSDSFQDTVSHDEKEELENNFNKDVRKIELIYNLPYAELTEYQRIHHEKDKRI